MPDVVCLGILVADVIGKPVDKWPERGKLELVDRMELHTGGCASNTGIGLARIGIHTAVIGKVGNDGFGDFIVGALRQNGIDCSGVARDSEEATSSTMVMVHVDGERSFIHYIGANAALVESDVDMSLITSSKILHLAGSLLLPGLDGEPSARILKAAKEAGVTTTLDTAWDSKGRWMSVLKPCLPHVDYMLPSLEEARMITGRQEPHDIATVLLELGVGTVALKMGEAGCYVRNKDVELAIPRFNVSVVDACGAGDAFVAGFLTGLVHGWDLPQTARFANAVGAMCVTAIGATTGVSGLKETEEFIRRSK